MSFPYWPNANGAYQQLNYVSSTQALSIVPGGNTVFLNTGGPNPSFSTITVFPGGNPISEVVIGGTPNNLVAVIAPSTNIAYMDLQLKDGAGSITDLARTNVIHDYGVTTVYSQNNGADFKGSVAILSSISTQGGGVVLTGADNTTFTVGNGAARVAGGIVAGTSAVALSNFAGDTATIPLNNVAYPLSAPFPITAGHTYRISANLTFNNVDATGTRTDLVVSGGGAGFPVYITSLQNGDLIPAFSGAAGGYSTVFLASANATVEVDGYNTSAIAQTSVTTQSASSTWVLEDLGIL